MVISVIIFLTSGFVGYVVGRWADNYLNFWMGDPHWVPDHWIYGLLLMVLSFFFFRSWWLYIFSFGLGHFVSDLNDFLHLKFYGSDSKDKAKRRFWHID